jgi:hypothetical protein
LRGGSPTPRRLFLLKQVNLFDPELPILTNSKRGVQISFFITNGVSVDGCRLDASVSQPALDNVQGNW